MQEMKRRQPRGTELRPQPQRPSGADAAELAVGLDQLEFARALAVINARLSRSFSFYAFFLMGRFHFVLHAVPLGFRFAKASGSPQVHRFCGYWSAHLCLRRRRRIPLKNAVKRTEPMHGTRQLLVRPTNNHIDERF